MISEKISTPAGSVQRERLSWVARDTQQPPSSGRSQDGMRRRRARAGGRGDFVASAADAYESRRRPLEVAGERRLDRGPTDRFSEECLDLHVQVASPHRLAPAPK